jgi:uncharacterized protein (TIGR02271 family)
VSSDESTDNTDHERLTIPIIEERAVLLSKPRAKATVRVQKVVHEREAWVEAPLRADELHIERALLDPPLPVEAPPPVRQEGDTTVIPILEERLVVEKRLVVREELRVRRVARTQLVHDRVSLRKEEVRVDCEQLRKHAAHGDKSSPQEPQEREMESLLIGVFDSKNDAEKARQELRACGLPDDRITVRGSTPDAAGAAAAGNDEEDHRGFFARLFGWHDADQPSSGVYSEAIRRGSYVVAVDSITDDRIDEAVQILQQNGAVDIDERASQWQAEGWTGAARTGERATAQMQAKSEPRTQMAGNSTKIPVVEEQLQVGKREVQRGGVRVFTRTTERPVQEDVTLREEHARVERHPVDRPATEAELGQAFQEKSVELRETVEEPVIAKTARVIEEVEVSKDVAERTERVQDTVRRTDVEVQDLGSGAGAPLKGETAGLAPSADFGAQRGAMDVDDINRLLRDELSAIETYRQALDKNRDEFGNDARFQQLVQMLNDHQHAATFLRQLIPVGGKESTDSGAWGTWANTVMGTAKLFGDTAALKALKDGEESGIKDYRELLEDQRVPSNVKNDLTSIVTQQQEHVRVLDRLIDAA